MQGLLGTSLTNPIFEVNHKSQSHEYDIYLGLTKLTTIPDDKNSLFFKSTIAMLVNAGIKIRHISKAFNISFVTAIKNVETFNDSFTSDEELIRKLKRPGRPTYKITPEISRYIFERAKYYKRLAPKRYIKNTIEDVRKEYHVTLSREAIRIKLKNNKSASDDIKTIKSEKKHSMDSMKNIISNDTDIVNESEITDTRLIEYAGIYLLHSLMKKLAGNINRKLLVKIPDLKSILRTWMTGIFLGAVNFESFRYFNKTDFNRVSMSVLPHVTQLRSRILDLSLNQETAFSGYLLKKNIEELIVRDNDYYIDGHFDEYTGIAPILEGWNTKKNRVTKGTVNYQVHDSAGNPVFSMISDTFEDFRDVIPVLIRRIRTLNPKSKKTVIYDRGGFKTELMREIASNLDLSFITWQKGFKQNESRSIKTSGSMEMALPYNELGKYRRYRLRYGEDVWSHDDFSCRRILIKRKKAEGKGWRWSSILTSDGQTEPESIIRKILGRFKQENDFKKQIAHFGLDEIVSHTTVLYKKTAGKDQSKEALTEKYRTLHEQFRELKEKRSNISSKFGIHIVKAIRGNRLPVSLSLKKRKAVKQIMDLNGKIALIKKELRTTAKKTSKLNRCIYSGKEILEMKQKRLLSVLKIVSRNIIEKGALDFLVDYENLRDYQKVFRLLIRRSGVVSVNDGVMTVRLVRMGHKKFQKRCEGYLNRINNENRTTMDGKYRLWFAWI